MAADEVKYLEERAEAELRLAQSAQHPAAVKAHYYLANFYLDRIFSGPTPGEPAVG